MVVLFLWLRLLSYALCLRGWMLSGFDGHFLSLERGAFEQRFRLSR
tara:strand:+ start:276 stop:413 length:138 start_codon:yes stop_codon:yes gene_type:complete